MSTDLDHTDLGNRKSLELNLTAALRTALETIPRCGPHLRHMRREVEWSGKK